MRALAIALLIGSPVWASAMRVDPRVENPGPAEHSRAEAPAVVLWAWERPEALDFIDARKVGVAFLAATIGLRGDRVIARPRLQPLSIPPGTWLMAVIRIETVRSTPAALSEAQQAAVIAHIGNLSLRGVAAIQLDFDARTSQRPFYRRLLLGLREQLPSSVGLSVAANASWCLYETWLAGVSLDEIVPMLYRMGRDGPEVLRYLNSGRDFRLPECRRSLGVSMDEPWPRLPPHRRVYAFNPRPWSRQAVEALLEGVRRWQ